MTAFIVQLAGRYRALADAPGALPDAADCLAGLTLAEAGLRQVAAGPRPVPHLAVIGPTQTGKSTVVNLLLGQKVARVSPLAGFTVHPQAFALLDAGEGTSADELLGPVLPGWRRVAPERLVRDDLETLGFCVLARRAGPATGGGAGPCDGPARGVLEHRFEFEAHRIAPGDTVAAPELPEAVVWDTPDFDSLSARRYQHGVLETLAAADVLLLVVSKEKYSDLSVWRLLRLLAPLGRPLVVCVNKLTPEAQEVIPAALGAKLRELGGPWGEAPVFGLPYEASLARGEPGRLAAEIGGLRERVGELLAAARSSRARAAGVRALIARHWDEWCAPLHAEHAALEQWRAQVDAGLDELMKSYRRLYLDNPQRFDTFRRAVAELLYLLEIPAAARYVAMARRALTAPARWLYDLRARSGSARDAVQPHPRHVRGSEQLVLAECVEKLLSALERAAAEREEPSASGCAVWRWICRRIRTQGGRLREQFEQAVQEHERRFAAEIRAAANRLHALLKEHPQVLAGLRVARVTSDAAMVALAIKTAGWAAVGLAPALLSLTSMLVEGALGTYMAGVAADLKRKQEQHLREYVVQAVMRPALLALGERLEEPELFGILPAEEQRAREALRTWQERGDG